MRRFLRGGSEHSSSETAREFTDSTSREMFDQSSEEVAHPEVGITGGPGCTIKVSDETKGMFSISEN
jgi:hypothetical protein